jgi:hypothetical protein
MNEFSVLVAVAVLVVLLVVSEILAAVLPLIIVVALVPPHERDDLAKVLAACDSSRRLRFWPALRTAVEARRRERRQDPLRNTPGDREAPFSRARHGESMINRPWRHTPDFGRQNRARPEPFLPAANGSPEDQ